MTHQPTSNDEMIDLLLEIVDAYEKDDRPRRKSADEGIGDKLTLLRERPPFRDYGLDEKDVIITAILFGNFFEEDDGMEARRLLRKIERDRRSVFRKIKRINRLKELGILEARRGYRLRSGRSLEDIQEDDACSAGGIELLRSTLRLSGHFLNRLCNTGVQKAAQPLEPYKDNLEYLSDQFTRLEFLRDDDDFLISPRRFRRPLRRFRTARGERLHGMDEIKRLEERISGRLQKTERTFPFEELKKKKRLSHKEEWIVLALLEREITGGGHYFSDELLDMISRTPCERLTDKKLLQKDGRLAKGRIIEIDSRSIDPDMAGIIRLNASLRDSLLEERRRRKKEIDRDRLFEVIRPSVSLDTVILHPRTLEEITLAIGMIQGGTLNILRGWGVKGSDLIQSASGKKGSPSVTMLFYGPPGTGKTLTANAVAYMMKRRLLTLDCSRVLSCWVGESEENTRRIFDRYREISEGMKNPPVLFLNEADQFLYRRISAVKSADHMYNQMQNIFLEQLEQFEGVLIATTNLVENMDTAFSRRFHYKVEFKRPGPDERLRLWQVHIPEKAPLAGDVDLRYLAERYDLSGSQIAVAVQNAATRGARKSNKISQGDFIRACEAELAGNFDDKGRVIAGF